MSQSTWETSDGLADDFDAEIVDAAFTYDPRYNNGQTCVLKLTLKSSDSDVGEQTVLYACGSDWEPADRGQSARYIGSKKPSFNKMSGIGQLITAVRESGALAAISGRGAPESANTWMTLSFHWNRKSYKDVGGTERSRLLPTSLNGASANGASASKADSGTIGGPLKATLMKLAAEAESHEQFVEAALATPGVSEAMRPAILSKEPGSIWATINN